MKYLLCCSLGFVLGLTVFSQDYHAIQGSSYAGSLGVMNNPASITSTPFTWDVTIIGAQAKVATNTFVIHNYSLLSSAENSTITANNGTYKRYGDLNFNINLLNARFALNRKQAIAFGANLRGYGRYKTGVANYNDSLHDYNEFFAANEGTRVYNGNFTGSSWIELFATYSRTLYDDPLGRLNGGITVKVMRGVGGAFAQLSNGTVTSTVNGSRIDYNVINGSARYGYGFNADEWKSSKSTNQNIRDFISNTRGGVAVDFGFEFLIKPQGVATVYDGDNYYDYDWKIGLSLLDLGYNQYRYGTRSRTAAVPLSNFTDANLDQKFDSISNIDNFNDSLGTIVQDFTQTNGKFKVYNPTRLVLNVDRYLIYDFYVNGELSVNIHQVLAGAKRFYTQSLNLFTLTPRWERKNLGVYMPIQYNMEGGFWIGGAFKAGPLLIGVHNWANVFAKNKIQNGGGYVALVLRSFKFTKAKHDSRLDCPKP